MMKYPESVAMKGHDYEELPSTRYVPAGSYKYDYADERGTHLISPSLGNINMASQPSMNTLTGSDLPHYPHRRRENPLYEAYDERDHLVKESAEKPGSHRCCHVLVTMICFLCVGMCVLIILMLTGMLAPMKAVETTEHPATAALRSSHNSTDYELHKALLRIKELEHQNQKLSEQFQHMQSYMVMQLNSIELSLSSQNQSIIQQKADLSNGFNTLQTEIVTVNSSLYKELETFSKMEGPMGPRGFNGTQGPTGAGDLSKCKSLHVSAGSSSDAIQGTWAPTAVQLKVTDISKWVVLGTECSSKGRTEHQLETRLNAEVTQYRCICSNSNMQQPSFCDITMWLCPVTS